MGCSAGHPEGARVNTVPGQNCKHILLYFTGECELLLILVSDRDRKKLIHQIEGHMHVH